MNFDLLVKSIIRESDENLSEKIVDGVRKGLNAQQIAKSLNKSIDLIYNALIELKIAHPEIPDEVIINANNKGLPSAQIADQFNITPLAVFYILNKRKNPEIVAPKPREHKRRKLTARRLQKYIDWGLTYEQIAERTRYTVNTVMRLVAAYNLQKPVKKQREYEQLDTDMLKDLYYKKMLSVPEIAKKLNRDKNWLGQKMREYGFKLRSSKESQQLRHKK